MDGQASRGTAQPSAADGLLVSDGVRLPPGRNCGFIILMTSWTNKKPQTEGKIKVGGGSKRG